MVVFHWIKTTWQVICQNVFLIGVAHRSKLSYAHIASGPKNQNTTMLPRRTGMIRLVGQVWVLFLLAGCAAFTPQPNAPWNTHRPAYTPPGVVATVPDSGSTVTARPTTPAIIPENDQVITLDPPDEKLPAGVPTPVPVPRSDTNDEQLAKIDGPRIVPQGVTVPAQLDLEVIVPDTKQVGSRTTYHLIITNTGDKPAENVVVESEFDDALIFPGRDVKKVRQEMGRLVGGESKELALTLVSDQTGKHCCRFSVLSGGLEKVWKSVCVENLPKQLDLSLVGPSIRTVGSRAEFTIKLSNDSQDRLEGLKVRVNHDAVLKPVEASSGAKLDAGHLEWSVGELDANQGIQLQVEFLCGTIAEHACLTVEVTGNNLPSEQWDACVKVVPVRGVLDVQVSDRPDPLSVGEEIEFVVIVINRGLQAVREIELSAHVPPQFRVLSSSVQTREGPIDALTKFERGALNFGAIPDLKPDGVLECVIRTKALQAGDTLFRVDVSHSASNEAASVTEYTTVNP